MVAAGLAMVCGLSALYRGLARGPVRIVAPVSALGAGIPVLFGALTGEELSVLRAAGAVLALLGIVTVTARESAAWGETSPGVVAAALHGAGAALGLGVAVVLLGLGGPAAPFASVATVRLTAAAFAGAALVLGARSGRHTKALVAPRAVGLVLGGGVLDCAANIAFVLAARSAVGLSGLLASLYPAVTVLLGVLVLGERLTRWQAGGLGLVCAGVFLLRF
jgi:drug/metabolite transporter (DMT)-like permease